jgi:hypothetical protein
MRFEEAYSGWSSKRLRQEEAAQLLGICERTFRRYIDRFEDEGLQGLIDNAWTRSRTCVPRSMRCCRWRRCTGSAMTGGR